MLAQEQMNINAPEINLGENADISNLQTTNVVE